MSKSYHKRAKQVWSDICKSGDKSKIEGASLIIAIYTNSPGFGESEYKGSKSKPASKPVERNTFKKDVDSNDDE